MEDDPSDNSYTYLSAEMLKECDLPRWSHSDCNDSLTNQDPNQDGPLSKHSELTNQGINVSNTTGGQTSSLNHVESSEVSYRTRSAGGRVKLTEAQRNANKIRSDRKYKEKQKRKAAEQIEENLSLKRKNEELNAKYEELLLTCHGQLSAKGPQRQGQDTCITSSTSEQLDRPSVSVQNCGLGSSHDLENLHQTAGTCIITPMTLLEKIDVDEESCVEVSDFTGLDGHREQVGIYSFPLGLVSTVKRVIRIYGDISVECKINHNCAETIYMLFYASIKEMDKIQLEQLTEDRILKWRDAIKDALRINFKVEFAMEHLRKIAQAYMGRKESQELKNMTQMISILEADLNAKKEELAKKKEQSKEHINDAEEFNGKSLSLFT